ncbi:pentapeptide repeat-containing protein [Actinomadura sp. NEAU-AAG7]|uniref:pentapeptide repeat-containing protein n=1 Tax=Actinomadura sp. NEAU-AAG7 TaxID=2839640 RepID=UPI001BE4BE3D|nr:pentapeptide repeat-containing protein [Actinomadura sp. NEAU-AAG7]MBT2207745.1 pentapeptide repeat-containing protein [Actinomadura sp. NEAU-AAG7]
MPPTKTSRIKEPARPKLPAAPAPAGPEHDLVDDEVLRELRFGARDLSGRDAQDVEIERCVFDGTRLPATVLERATVADSAFDRCDLANLRLTNARMFNATVTGSRMTGAALTDCAFQDVVYEACRADLAGFRFSTFKRVVFRDCNLEGATFQNADLRGVRFQECRLDGAQFSGATMTGARFSGCDLRGVAGVQSMRGVTVSAMDAPGLLASFAAELDITIEDS